MRIATTFLLVLTCILSLASAKEAAPKQEKCLIAEYPSVDFEMISTAEKTVAVEVLKSTGTQPVTIKSFKIVGDDPDLSVSTPIAPFVMKPNQTTNIGVTFDPHVAGNATADFIMETDSKTTPVVVVHITAKAYDPTLDRALLTPTISRLYKVVA